MANINSTSTPHLQARPGEYRFSPLDRAAILAGSDSAKFEQKIERQRQDFIQKNGTDLPNLEE